MRNELTYRGRAYDDDALQLPSMAVDTSLNGRVLDVDTMQVTIQQPKSAGAFNPDVDQSLPVPFLRGGSQQSLWYASSVTHVGEAFYLLGLTSSLGRLLQMEHRGGVYSGETAQALIDEICGPVPHYVDPAFQSIRLYGHLPYLSPSGQNGAQKGSAKDNLLQVLFAINATVRDDAQGVLRIENLSTGVSSNLDADRIFRATTRIRHETPVTSVTVLEHQYIPGGTLTTLFEGTAAAGQVIVFDEPMSNLSATGFSITESNANYAVLSAGSGTLTGQAYTHTTREITLPVTTAGLPNPVRIEGATLVSLTNSNNVVSRLQEYYTHRIWIECEASILHEDAGDVISIWDALSKTMRQACIEMISPLRASNIMRGTISALIGYLPWQVVPFDDERVLLTGSGSWTVPAGVTQLTIVLIGGGTNGENGANGTASTGSKNYTNSAETPVKTPGSGSVTATASYSSSAGAPGSGGKGGKGGTGGKILRFEITVSPGSVCTFSCGNGGASPGDTEITINGTLFSSSNGSSDPAGFFDVVTQQLFGVSGSDGNSGGAGGSAGSNGADVGAAKGGAGIAAYSESKTGTDSNASGSASFNVGGAGGGGAGGNSGSRQGSSGGDASGLSQTFLVDEQAIGGMGYEARVSAVGNRSSAGNGGNGANGANATNYGNGGDGGGGGGGAGAVGSVSVTANSTCKYTNVPVIDYNHRYSAIAGVATRGKETASGGYGGNGGVGMAGCGIAYYRRPATS